ncbi:AmmeMemoRadiSam system radical SAM enzyme [candidate division KSB1 bacterium]|nr:AmmeMemoRadiSam system radical SAM enzyme [candidate division KSB1 bacterium]
MTKKISRRKFIKDTAILTSAGCLMSDTLTAKPRRENLTEARYYEKLENSQIRCLLCPRKCVVADKQRGYCEVRENRDGTYYTLVHSRPCTAHIDPIEKKPLFHFLPGSLAFSIATVGCNVDCKFCQNWQISQVRPEEIESLDMPPERVAELARSNGCPTIAYTYTEPTIFTEYMYDCAAAGHGRGVRSVMISNGYINKQPMTDLCGVLDAVKIDLKAFTEKFYRELVGGELKPVMDTLLTLKKNGIWFEIVYLMIPTHNDDPDELKQMCQWIVSELGRDVPIHFTRFYPQYRLKNLPPTPISTLVRAREIALEAGINFSYVGNIPGHEGENTYCPHCGATVIKRIGYSISENKIKDGKCSACDKQIPGVWN